MTSALVTGHTGFIGRHVVTALESRGVTVTPASRRVGIDLSNQDALAGVPRADVVVHLAGRAGVPESWRDPAGYMRDNLLPAITVFEQARIWQVPVVLMSSYMYGTPATALIDEDHPLDCNNPYARAKRMVEVAAEGYHRDFGVPVTVLRPFTLYGPGQGTDSLAGKVLPQVLNADEIVVDDLAPRRDFMHVGDLANAVALAALAPANGWTVYNAGTGISHSVADFIETAQRLAGTAKPVRSRGAARPNEIADCRADARRLCEALGWTAAFDLASGLAATLDTIRTG